MSWFGIVYLVGIVPAIILTTMASGSYFREKYPMLEWTRGDMVTSLAFGILWGLLWPVGIPLNYLLSQRYRYGLTAPIFTTRISEYERRYGEKLPWERGR